MKFFAAANIPLYHRHIFGFFGMPGLSDEEKKGNKIL